MYAKTSFIGFFDLTPHILGKDIDNPPRYHSVETAKASRDILIIELGIKRLRICGRALASAGIVVQWFLKVSIVDLF